MSELPPSYADYPRPGTPAGGSYQRPPGVYFEAIGEAWKLVLQDLGHWVAATIVLLAVTYGLSLPVSLWTQTLMPKDPNAPNFVPSLLKVLGVQMVLSLFIGVFYQVILVGMVAMGVRKSRGEYINVGMIFEPFRRFWPVALASLLYWIIYYVASIACVLPVLFFGPVLLMMPVVAYMRNVGPIEALSITFDACRAHWLGLLGLAIVCSVLLVFGFVACCIGALIALPIVVVTFSIHYRAFFESSYSPMAG